MKILYQPVCILILSTDAIMSFIFFFSLQYRNLSRVRCYLQMSCFFSLLQSRIFPQPLFDFYDIGIFERLTLPSPHHSTPPPAFGRTFLILSLIVLHNQIQVAFRWLECCIGDVLSHVEVHSVHLSFTEVPLSTCSRCCPFSSVGSFHLTTNKQSVGRHFKDHENVLLIKHFSYMWQSLMMLV